MQPGVIRCSAPDHEVGKVDLVLFFEGQPVGGLAARSLSQKFEYREKLIKSMKKKRGRADEVSDQGQGDT